MNSTKRNFMEKYLLKVSSLIIPVFLCFKITAQDGLQISLRIEYEQEKTVMHNEPVIFVVTAVNKSVQSDNLWNIAADRRIRQIDELVKQGKMKQEDADKEKQELEKGKRSSPVISIGSSSSPWAAQLKWLVKNMQTKQPATLPVKLMANPAADPIVTLDGSQAATAYFGIAPDEMQNIPAGDYEISTALNGNEDKVLLHIQQQAASQSDWNEAILYKLGLFYWHSGDAKKMIEYAELILNKNPASTDGLSLKGDAQVMNKEYKEALSSYSTALKNYYKQNGAGAEPPEYLLSMIGMVKEKLGEIKN